MLILIMEVNMKYLNLLGAFFFLTNVDASIAFPNGMTSNITGMNYNTSNNLLNFAKATIKGVIPEECFKYKEVGNSIHILDYHHSDSDCLSDVVIPSVVHGKKVTTIRQLAFADSEISSVIIPNSVTTIGHEAFLNNKLTSVVIPDSVTTIGSWVFAFNMLTSVIIPDSVTTIGAVAFHHNNLTSVIIPDSVTTIGDGAFKQNNLTSIEIPYHTSISPQGAFDTDVVVRRRN
jgi:hypothetical protein